MHRTPTQIRGCVLVPRTQKSVQKLYADNRSQLQSALISVSPVIVLQ